VAKTVLELARRKSPQEVVAMLQLMMPEKCPEMLPNPNKSHINIISVGNQRFTSHHAMAKGGRP